MQTIARSPNFRPIADLQRSTAMPRCSQSDQTFSAVVDLGVRKTQTMWNFRRGTSVSSVPGSALEIWYFATVDDNPWGSTLM